MENITCVRIKIDKKHLRIIKNAQMKFFLQYQTRKVWLLSKQSKFYNENVIQKKMKTILLQTERLHGCHMRTKFLFFSPCNPPFFLYFSFTLVGQFFLDRLYFFIIHVTNQQNLQFVHEDPRVKIEKPIDSTVDSAVEPHCTVTDLKGLKLFFCFWRTYI